MNTNYFINYSPIGQLTVFRKISLLLLVIDTVALTACLYLFQGLVFGFGAVPTFLSLYYFLLVIVVLLSLYIADTYRPDTQIYGLRAPARIIISLLAAIALISSLLYFLRRWGIDESPFFHKLILFPALGTFALFAIASRMLTVSRLRQVTSQNRWLVLGASENVVRLVEDLKGLRLLGKAVVLNQDLSSATAIQTPPAERLSLNIAGSLSELSTWLHSGITGVVIDPMVSLDSSQISQLMNFRLNGVPIYTLCRFYEFFWYKLPSVLLQDEWFALSGGFSLQTSRPGQRLKRLGDIVFSSLLLILLSPLMLLTAVAIKLNSPGPIFYSQTRTGQYCKPFKVYKFRSMYQDAEKRGAQWASKRDPRITRVGYWIRLTRIDELPQFWNVLKGDMSMIGPRPERPEFDVKLAQEIPYYQTRYLVKPGITGWAQVFYPYGASVHDAREKLAYDLYYLKNFSLWLDVAIVLKTLRVVILGKGR
ncbi:MAG: sugar transferase [Cyanobacteria bacterium REEB459]|nr:sugar transferase [Cyanobacteria bacterium REEB459]